MMADQFMTVYLSVLAAWAVGLCQGTITSWALGLETENKRMAGFIPALLVGAILMCVCLAYATKGLMP